MQNSKPIYVTQPSLPPLDEFVVYLKEIWDSKVITNMGPFHNKFEEALARYLGVKYISLFSNGTLALITALQALHITGEVITSPFSFVATSHSLWWNNIKPVFVDVDQEYFNIDPKKIEAAITSQTTAILPVHVYGNPCKIEEINHIAEKYSLKVIYDAAHAFGVLKNGDSILNFGDLSILSFHATKVFNTVEGGAIVCHDKKMKEHIDFLKNFGFADEVTVVMPGINAKMNEIQAAYGLLQLKHIDSNIEKRKTITEIYRKQLYSIKGIKLLTDMDGVIHAYTYFPILIDPVDYGYNRDYIYEKLKNHNIYCRRYFYPLISQFSPYSSMPSSKSENIPIATLISEQVICLPLYPSLDLDIVYYICDLLKNNNRE